MLWLIIALLVWIGLWIKFIIYLVPPDPVMWYCQGFGYLWQSLMMSWMIFSSNDLNVSHRNQVNNSSDVMLATYVMTFECHTCGIFKGILHYQEDETISPTNFAASVGLRDRIKELV